MIGGCLYLAGAPERLRVLASGKTLPACHDDVGAAVNAARAAQSHDTE
ncbi:hypothetical protein S1361_00765 [Streptomyces cyanogenus]|uniref:Uncharacterized protein n=1 Tax=Streptomyces cyanogenus TaxID=80860 RepID=A0ABX7TKF5_STRCY|nr:hypothetical protein S1361_00765 [Streptomyces cyanogenus]